MSTAATDVTITTLNDSFDLSLRIEPKYLYLPLEKRLYHVEKTIANRRNKLTTHFKKWKNCKLVEEVSRICVSLNVSL